MQHPFEALRPEYSSLLSGMRVLRVEEVDDVARKLLGLVAAGRYAAACYATKTPIIVAASSFEREASSNFRLSPAQGDPWGEVSKRVPKGAGPFMSWAQAAEWTYRHEGFDKVGAWSWERACFEEEALNGFGYRSHGIHSPYLWAGTNHYTTGKFVADGRFQSGVRDVQLGVVPVMRRMVQINAALDLFRAQMSGNFAPPPSPMPGPAPEGLHNAAALQEHLNALGAHLIVDGNYGRVTRAAVRDFQRKAALTPDGIAGPDTWAAIEHA